MSFQYYINRYPPDVAVDVLALRRRIQDIDDPGVRTPIHYYHASPPPTPPTTIDFVNVHNHADMAMLVGPSCKGFDRPDGFVSWYLAHESDDPLVWATRGRRRVGWHAHVPKSVGAGEFPLRYSLLDDCVLIRRALQSLSVETLRTNLDACFAAGVVASERREGPDRDRLTQVADDLLLALRQFYQAVVEGQEMVLYVLR